VSSFKVISTSEPLYPGTKSLALDTSGDLALTGGADGIAGIYSVSQQQLLRPLKATDGAINDVAWAATSAVTASSSGVVRVWNEQGNDSIAMIAHAGDVVALAVHPSKSILASVGADKSWVLYDLEAGKSVVQVYDPSSMFYPSPRFRTYSGN
jgi:pre-mRNA-processing factor 19